MIAHAESSARRRRAVRAAVLGIAVCLVSLVLAMPARGDNIWQKSFTKADALLAEGRYTAAKGVTSRFLDELGSQVAAGSEKALGTVFAMHALAEAGSGEQRQAEFDWYLAQSLNPDLVVTSLDRYGVAGERLDAFRFASGNSCRIPDPRHEIYDLTDPGLPLALRITPPEKVHTPPPVYSQAAREHHLEGATVIQVMIKTDGQVYAPCLQHWDSPIFAYETAKALKEWRFRPAQLDGVPVDVYYNLTVNFELRK